MAPLFALFYTAIAIAAYYADDASAMSVDVAAFFCFLRFRRAGAECPERCVAITRRAAPCCC